MKATESRYTAYATDNTILYQANTAQRIGDAVFGHITCKRLPEIAYTFDNSLENGFPYTTWDYDEWWHIVGTSHKTFEEAISCFQGEMK
jgi:hypothetical protein